MFHLCNNYDLTLRATKGLNKRSKDPKREGEAERR